MLTGYSISKFAKMVGVHPETLRRWDASRKLIPNKVGKLRRYDDSHLQIVKNQTVTQEVKTNILYLRESTKQQRSSLVEQETKAKEFCIAGGIRIDKVYSEYGSAMNYNRPKLKCLISDLVSGNTNTLVIFYKDRLVRFGFEFFEHLSEIFGFKIIVIDNSESNKSKEKEFADDLISIIHYFSMKLYGSRSYKKKIQKAEQNIEEIKNEII